MADKTPCEKLKGMAGLVVGMANLLVMEYRMAKNAKEKQEIRYKIKYLENIYGQIRAAWTSKQYGCGDKDDLPSFPELPSQTEGVAG